MGKRSTDKGKRYERQIARKLSEWSGERFGRTAFSRGPKTATKDLETPHGFVPVIECKHREGWSWDAAIQGKGPVWGWWDQAREQAVEEGSSMPWLILTRNRQPDWLVVCTVGRSHLRHTYGLAALATFPGPGAYVYLLDRVLEVTDFTHWLTPEGRAARRDNLPPDSV